jgi:deoxyribose-phosphate aldolase
LGVKASGGIRTYEAACGFLNQGCRRLGIGATAAVLDAAPER